ncbi:MAG: Transcriptional regulator, PadR family, partial [uncultured Pseudonocardia sp.]
GHHTAAQGGARPGGAVGARRLRRLRLRRRPAAARRGPGRRRRRVGLRHAAAALRGRPPDLLRGALRGGAAPQVLRPQRLRPRPAGDGDQDLAGLRRHHDRAPA